MAPETVTAAIRDLCDSLSLGLGRFGSAGDFQHCVVGGYTSWPFRHESWDHRVRPACLPTYRSLGSRLEASEISPCAKRGYAAWADRCLKPIRFRFKHMKCLFLEKTFRSPMIATYMERRAAPRRLNRTVDGTRMVLPFGPLAFVAWHSVDTQASTLS